MTAFKYDYARYKGIGPVSSRYLRLNHGRGAVDLGVLGLFGLLQLALILTHVGFGFWQARNPDTPWPDLLNISRDFSLGEITNYVLWSIAITSFYVGWARKKDPLVLAVALIFLLALSDDMFRLQDSGNHLVMHLNSHVNHGERMVMFGELAIWVVLGVLCIAGLAMSWRGSGPDTRSALVPQAVLFLVLIFFAVGLDFIHDLAKGRTVFAGLLEVIEDGGEMIVLTFMAAHAWPTFGRPALQASHR